MRSLTRAAIGAAMATPLALGFFSATAHAEQAPGCSSTVQIGSTAYVNLDGQTFASVKQFKGCGKNYGYLYVWSGYRATHSNWDVCVSIATVDSAGRHLVDLQCPGKVTEAWSLGSATLDQCTVAVGWYPDRASAATDVRC
ncbi:hypothetical protein [Actinomadura harenae]|uniref:Secreted protein n=1 Tax=Actinomadura harenae TaxID=2483351 RepID=A0A3M2LKB1_9ACTN|nr:hypothetical protein [Actinomadura harenae]RMI37917.1 hypothetical protein EBO15_34480 [Actinomadura harenae]